MKSSVFFLFAAFWGAALLGVLALRQRLEVLMQAHLVAPMFNNNPDKITRILYGFVACLLVVLVVESVLIGINWLKIEAILANLTSI